MSVMVVPGGTPAPLTHMPVDRFEVPERVSAVVPLAPMPSWEREGLPPVKIKIPVPVCESVPERLMVLSETPVTVWLRT